VAGSSGKSAAEGIGCAKCCVRNRTTGGCAIIVRPHGKMRDTAHLTAALLVCEHPASRRNSTTMSQEAAE
jgi:hypothetical protein